MILKSIKKRELNKSSVRFSKAQKRAVKEFRQNRKNREKWILKE